MNIICFRTKAFPEKNVWKFSYFFNTLYLYHEIFINLLQWDLLLFFFYMKSEIGMSANDLRLKQRMSIQKGPRVYMIIRKVRHFSSRITILQTMLTLVLWIRHQASYSVFKGIYKIRIRSYLRYFGEACLLLIQG